MGAEFGGKFEDVWMGWNEFRGIGRFVDGGSEEIKVLTEVAWRQVRGVWRQEAQRHPKLHLIGIMVKSKMRRRRLVKLRGGEQQSWQLKLEDGGV